MTGINSRIQLLTFLLWPILCIEQAKINVNSLIFLTQTNFLDEIQMSYSYFS